MKKVFIFTAVFVWLLTLNPGGAGAEAETLVIGTKEAAPFSIKTGEGTWEGISIDLWRQIAAELNLKYEFREFDLKQLLEAVSKGAVDAAVGALTLTADREKLMDFTHTFFSTGLGMAVASKKKNPWTAVFRRFLSLAFLKVIVTLAFVLLVVGLLVWWFERKKNPDQFGGSATKGIGAGFWWSAVTMTTVGYGDKAPVTFWGRFFALVWMFAAIIIISGFTAAITASLTVTQLESGVRGPEDLVKIRVGTVPNTTSESYLKSERISFSTYTDVREGLEALNGGEIDAFVYDRPLLLYRIQQRFRQSLTVLPDILSPQQYAIALPPGSSLREPVNIALLQKVREKEWRDKIFQYLGE